MSTETTPVKSASRRGRPASIKHDFPNGLSIEQQLDWLRENNPGVADEKLSKFVISGTFGNQPTPVAPAQPKKPAAKHYRMYLVELTPDVEAVAVREGKFVVYIYMRAVNADWVLIPVADTPFYKGLERTFRAKSGGARLVATYLNLKDISLPPRRVVQNDLPFSS